MTMTMTQAPPKRGNALHFERTLQNITKVRPRYPVDTWTIEDAAEFWVPGYDYTKVNAVTPYLIVGLVARLVTLHLFNHPKFYPLLFGMRKRSRVLIPAGVNPPVIPATDVVRMFYRAYQYDGTAGASEVGYSSCDVDGTAILSPSNSEGYCHRTSCNFQESFMGQCIREDQYDKCKSFGMFIPWASVEWGGLATWLAPMRLATDTPYVAIRRKRSHITDKVVTTDVADAIGYFHRFLPQHLLNLRHYTSFASPLAKHIEQLEGEKLRYSGMVLHNPDYDFRMSRWDVTFGASCWSFGKRDKVYADFSDSYWGLEDDKFDAISENQLDDLFPALPQPL